MSAEQDDYERMTVRLPRVVHSQLREMARSNRRSVNGEIIVILEAQMAENKTAGEPVKTTPTA